MDTVLRPLVVLALSGLTAWTLAAPAQAAGRAEVAWVEPERFVDIGRSAVDRERTMRSLGEHITQLAQRLPDGQVLQVQITDVDLAGEVEPLGWNQLRILRGRADWPQIALRYTLAGSDGRVLAERAERLADMAYLMRTRDGDLGYEKRLLDDWFKARFAAPAH